MAGKIGAPTMAFDGCWVNATFVGICTLNELDAAEISAPSVAVSVKVPAVAILKLLKVATPLTVLALAVLPPPVKVPPLLRVNVTAELPLVKVLPYWSRTVTVTAGEIGTPDST